MFNIRKLRDSKIQDVKANIIGAKMGIESTTRINPTDPTLPKQTEALQRYEADLVDLEKQKAELLIQK